MQHGGVVAAAKASPDLGQRAAGKLARQIHRDLARTGDAAGALRRMEILDFQLVEFRRLALDVLDRRLGAGAGTQAHRFFRCLQGHRLLGQVGIGRQLGEDADQLARAGIIQIGNPFQHIVGQHHFGLVAGEFRRPRLHDGQTRFTIRLVQRDAKPTGQARFDVGAKPFQRLRRAVSGNHHPAAQIGKGIDGIEKLRRRGGGAADMLQIVNDQHFGGAQLFLESQRILAIKRAQEVAHEIFRPQEQSALAALAEFQGGGVQQMRLAEAKAAMDVKQRNVALLAFGKSARRAMAELVGGPRYKAVKGLLRMQHPCPQSLGGIVFAAFGARRQIGNIAGGHIGRRDIAQRIAANAGRRRRHHDGKRCRLGAFGAEGALDAGDIMIGHPVAHERLAGADLEFIPVAGFQAQRPDPRFKHRIAQFPTQPVPNRTPRRRPIRPHGLPRQMSHSLYPHIAAR